MIIDSEVLPLKFKEFFCSNARFSRSQYGQDIFVLYMNQFHKIGEVGRNFSGFFVEFGATDGVNLSNSWMLEKYFGWTGILAEPARKWKKHLFRNRKVLIDNSCVYSETGIDLDFFEAEIGSLSTIEGFQKSDFHERKSSSSKYMVRSITLEDLLRKHDAPNFVGYLSIDTEGSEFEILKDFDFECRKIGIITVEHNFTVTRDLICSLLEGNGFMRVLRDFSQCDDWYVNRKYFDLSKFV